MNTEYDGICRLIAVILKIGYPNLKIAIDMLINMYRLNVVILGDWLSLERF